MCHECIVRNQNTMRYKLIILSQSMLILSLFSLQPDSTVDIAKLYSLEENIEWGGRVFPQQVLFGG